MSLRETKTVGGQNRFAWTANTHFFLDRHGPIFNKYGNQTKNDDVLSSIQKFFSFAIASGVVDHDVSLSGTGALVDQPLCHSGGKQ